MAVALTVGTLLSVAGLLVTSVQGFAVASGLSADPLAGALVGRHVGYAIPTVLFSLFSQSMVIFFFIGTGKLVKEDTAGCPEDQRRRVLEALRDLKRKTSPPATFAIASSIGVFVLGGAVHTRALPSWTHLAASIAAIAVHVWALAAEWRAFGQNARLMADPRRYVDDRSANGPRPSWSPPRSR